ncbi:hypothetical protein ACFLZY_01725 [Patescibacteria group bacterium]
MSYFFENPTDYSPPKAERLANLNKELTALEKQWIEDQESIDSLRLELGR